MRFVDRRVRVGVEVVRVHLVDLDVRAERHRVADDAPDAVVDSLECDAGANRVAVPETFVADDDGDRVRLVV